jgi:hypothetical protein
MVGPVIERVRTEIHDRAAVGTPLDVIEAEVIEREEGLSDEQRASLWLYAWNLDTSPDLFTPRFQPRERLIAASGR